MLRLVRRLPRVRVTQRRGDLGKLAARVGCLACATEWSAHRHFECAACSQRMPFGKIELAPRVTKDGRTGWFYCPDAECGALQNTADVRHAWHVFDVVSQKKKATEEREERRESAMQRPVPV